MRTKNFHVLSRNFYLFYPIYLPQAIAENLQVGSGWMEKRLSEESDLTMQMIGKQISSKVARHHFPKSSFVRKVKMGLCDPFG